MKRYTRDARMMVTWDRHDIANMGTDCEDERYATRKLVDLAMMAVRALRKTSIGVERGSKDLQALAEWGESVGVGTGPSQMGNLRNEENVSDGIRGPDVPTVDEVVANDTEEDPHSPAIGKETLISECAPKGASTKGRKRKGKQIVRVETSNKKATGVRNCGHCGLKGHYSTSCEINPDNEWKKSSSSGSLRGKMGKKRGRPPEFDDVA